MHVYAYNVCVCIVSIENMRVRIAYIKYVCVYNVYQIIYIHISLIVSHCSIYQMIYMQISLILYTHIQDHLIDTCVCIQDACMYRMYEKYVCTYRIYQIFVCV